jgi:hypothetical protein
MRTLSINKLAPLTTSVDKIKLAQAFCVDGWFEDAYLDVCMAPDLPCDDDLVAMGFDVFRKMARAREALRSCKLRKHDANERRAIVKETFGLQREGMRGLSRAHSESHPKSRCIVCVTCCTWIAF